ncbi:hypothetical protein M9458_049220, partial [Cirrhinus mrigala]
KQCSVRIPTRVWKVFGVTLLWRWTVMGWSGCRWHVTLWHNPTQLSTPSDTGALRS